MRTTLYAICALAIGGALWWVLSVVHERDALQADLRSARIELATARAALEQAAEAARVHRAYLEKAEEERGRWEALALDLQNMEGRDAPLSDLLGATAERLYGR